jgi:hypothetical protein
MFGLEARRCVIKNERFLFPHKQPSAANSQIGTGDENHVARDHGFELRKFLCGYLEAPQSKREPSQRRTVDKQAGKPTRAVLAV